jgi:Asp-tRNA(Asn)/Glu-tRNA(Gln) amidotransferase A subunit family amidase
MTITAAAHLIRRTASNRGSAAQGSTRGARMNVHGIAGNTSRRGAMLDATSNAPKRAKQRFETRYAAKDKTEVAGLLHWTPECPAFGYEPMKSAPVVRALETAGATRTGKTNPDQFATGLVGTRSSYG